MTTAARVAMDRVSGVTTGQLRTHAKHIWRGLHESGRGQKIPIMIPAIDSRYLRDLGFLGHPVHPVDEPTRVPLSAAFRSGGGDAQI